MTISRKVNKTLFKNGKSYNRNVLRSNKKIHKKKIKTLKKIKGGASSNNENNENKEMKLALKMSRELGRKDKKPRHQPTMREMEEEAYAEAAVTAEVAGEEKDPNKEVLVQPQLKKAARPQKKEERKAEIRPSEPQKKAAAVKKSTTQQNSQNIMAGDELSNSNLFSLALKLAGGPNKPNVAVSTTTIVSADSLLLDPSKRILIDEYYDRICSELYDDEDIFGLYFKSHHVKESILKGFHLFGGVCDDDYKLLNSMRGVILKIGLSIPKPVQYRDELHMPFMQGRTSGAKSSYPIQMEFKPLKSNTSVRVMTKVSAIKRADVESCKTIVKQCEEIANDYDLSDEQARALFLKIERTDKGRLIVQLVADPKGLKDIRTMNGLTEPVIFAHLDDGAGYESCKSIAIYNMEHHEMMVNETLTDEKVKQSSMTAESFEAVPATLEHNLDDFNISKLALSEASNYSLEEIEMNKETVVFITARNLFYTNGFTVEQVEELLSGFTFQIICHTVKDEVSIITDDTGTEYDKDTLDQYNRMVLQKNLAIREIKRSQNSELQHELYLIAKKHMEENDSMYLTKTRVRERLFMYKSLHAQHDLFATALLELKTPDKIPPPKEDVENDGRVHLSYTGKLKDTLENLLKLQRENKTESKEYEDYYLSLNRIISPIIRANAQVFEGTVKDKQEHLLRLIQARSSFPKEAGILFNKVASSLVIAYIQPVHLHKGENRASSVVRERAELSLFPIPHSLPKERSLVPLLPQNITIDNFDESCQNLLDNLKKRRDNLIRLITIEPRKKRNYDSAIIILNRQIRELEEIIKDRSIERLQLFNNKYKLSSFDVEPVSGNIFQKNVVELPEPFKVGENVKSSAFYQVGFAGSGPRVEKSSLDETLENREELKSKNKSRKVTLPNGGPKNSAPTSKRSKGMGNALVSINLLKPLHLPVMLRNSSKTAATRKKTEAKKTEAKKEKKTEAKK
jgi:hypothetical protein